MLIKLNIYTGICPPWPLPPHFPIGGFCHPLVTFLLRTHKHIYTKTHMH